MAHMRFLLFFLSIASVTMPGLAQNQISDYQAATTVNPTDRILLQQGSKGTPYTYGTPAQLQSKATGTTTSRLLGDRAADVINVKDWGAKGDGGTNDTAAIQAAAAAIPTTGAQLLFPRGNYIISGPTTVPSFTYVYGQGATITASAAGAWPSGQIQQAFQGATSAKNITIEGLTFSFPQGAYGGGAAHIIEMASSNSHIIVKNNFSDGGGNFTSMVGTNDVLETGNIATNISNSCYDHWGGATDVRTIGNYCTTLSSAGAGVGAIQFTGIATNGGPANSVGFICTDNVIFINNGNSPQAISINGHASSGQDDKVIVANNKIIINGQAAWGVLINGLANNVDIHDNYFEGSTGSFSAVGAFTPATNVRIHDNIAVNWQGGANAVYANTTVSGSISNNVAYSSGTLLGSTDATTVVYGNGTGTNAVNIANAHITSGDATFSGALVGSGGISSIFGPTWGFNGSGGVTETLNNAVGHPRVIVSQTAGLNRWAIVPGDGGAEGGSNAGSDFSISNYNDAGTLISVPITLVRASGHLVVASSGTPAVTTGSADCGTSPSIVGNDNAGRVTVGSSTNGGKCTLTFDKTWTTAPVCSVQNETTANAVRPVTATSTLAITGTLTAADKLTYRCVGF